MKWHGIGVTMVMVDCLIITYIGYIDLLCLWRILNNHNIFLVYLVYQLLHYLCYFRTLLL